MSDRTRGSFGLDDADLELLDRLSTIASAVDPVPDHVREMSRALFAFRLGTGRLPTERELKSVLSFREEQYKYFEDRSAAALAVAVPSLKNVPSDVNLHKVAAWAMVSRAILNLDETMTKE